MSNSGKRKRDQSVQPGEDSHSQARQTVEQPQASHGRGPTELTSVYTGPRDEGGFIPIISDVWDDSVADAKAAYEEEKRQKALQGGSSGSEVESNSIQPRHQDGPHNTNPAPTGVSGFHSSAESSYTSGFVSPPLLSSSTIHGQIASTEHRALAEPHRSLSGRRPDMAPATSQSYGGMSGPNTAGPSMSNRQMLGPRSSDT
jgi:hypothetical protein